MIYYLHQIICFSKVEPTSNYLKCIKKYSTFPPHKKIPTSSSVWPESVKKFLYIVMSMEKFLIKKNLIIVLIHSECPPKEKSSSFKPDKIEFQCLTWILIPSLTFLIILQEKNRIWSLFKPFMIADWSVWKKKGNTTTTDSSWHTMPIHLLQTPNQFVDTNQWTINGLTNTSQKS